MKPPTAQRPRTGRRLSQRPKEQVTSTPIEPIQIREEPHRPHRSCTMPTRAVASLSTSRANPRATRTLQHQASRGSQATQKSRNEDRQTRPTNSSLFLSKSSPSSRPSFKASHDCSRTTLSAGTSSLIEVIRPRPCSSSHGLGKFWPNSSLRSTSRCTVSRTQRLLESSRSKRARTGFAMASQR